ncbi:LysR family transcriptional regulator [Bradyrhizobium sp. 48]|uniref:LysR family transcriptional regulator n=1 Tax=Bradyrhizobium sp. 48 TaxID=2782676 RepID=UPI001FF75749|nr:LysR family transcriptional regulator [Bradyrhizobium sp. 48]MCK1446666.1 LysR family transcriptional regulator [Bradyrhizobium sp. 48]
MEKDPGWELYRSFLAVLREGSLSGAARTLGLTQPTISRHVKELEITLGTSLFTRAQDGLRPTTAGRAIEPHAQAMAAAAATLVRTISSNEALPRAVVRIAASEIVATEVLPPILTEFRTGHPEIIIELSVSDRAEDLLRRDSDIAVRMTRPKQATLVARRIGQVTLGLYAHRRYLGEHGRPHSMHDLTQHALIGFDREGVSIRALRQLGMNLRRDDFALRTDSHVAQLAAIRAGFGIGICQTAVARRDPALVRLLPNEFSLSLQVWIAMHEDLRSSSPMRAVFEHLAAALSGYVRARGLAQQSPI